MTGLIKKIKTGHLRLLTIAGIAFAALPLHANDMLRDYLKIGAENNPGLKASYSRYMAMVEKAPQVGSLPDPQVSIGYFLEPMALMMGDQVAQAQFMQMFPWFGTLQAAEDEASQMARAAFESFRNDKSMLFYRIKTAYYDLYNLQSEQIYLRETIKIYRSLEEMALIKYQAAATPSGSANMSSIPAMPQTGISPASTGMAMGAATTSAKNAPPAMSSATMSAKPASGFTDVLRLKMQLLDFENRLAAKSDAFKTAQVNFNILLNRDINEPVILPDSLQMVPMSFTREALADSLLQQNPMLKMYREEERAFAYSERMADKMGLPMFGIGAQYMLVDERAGVTSPNNGMDMVMPMVTFSLPIYRGKYNAQKREAQYRQKQAAYNAREWQNKLKAENQRLLEKLDDAMRRIDLNRQNVVLANQIESLLRTEYSTSATSYDAVLQAHQKVLEYRFAMVQAIVDYNNAVAEAEQLLAQF